MHRHVGLRVWRLHEEFGHPTQDFRAQDGLDDVDDRRERYRELANRGQRVGYTLFGLSMVLFFVGLATSFSSSLVGVLVAVLVGALVVGRMDALTGVTLAMASGLVVMAGIPMLQLAMTEGLHPFDRQLPGVALRGGAITLIGGTAALVASRLPDAAALPLIALIAITSIWSALRFALPEADRASLGKTGRRLRLIDSRPA